jgi:hypothetical protein
MISSNTCWGFLVLLLMMQIYSVLVHSWIHFSPSVGRRSRCRAVVLRSSLSEKPRPSSSGFSYVEEGEYTTSEEEVDAMGGDPFFLDDFDDSSSSSDAVDEVAAWEWDGIVDDDAHMD